MKCLVVISHPLKESLCHHLASETITHLESKGYEIEVLDLYQSQFSPALTQPERASYYQPDFDQTDLSGHIEQLKRAESLVLIFPTWWFGFPAILKGWFDRVWAPGHAYNHASNLGPITPCLENLKEVKVVTTLGSPWWVDRFVLWQPVKRVLKIALLGACAKNYRFKMLSLYKSEALTDAKISGFIKKIKANF